MVTGYVVGWCIGTIRSRNTDGRFFKTIDGVREKVNFRIHYEIDDEEVTTVLRADVYDGEDEDGAWVQWVLLQAVAEPEVAAAEVAAAGPSGA